MKIFISSILSIIIITGLVYAEDSTSTYSSKDGYELYKQRVQNICNDYNYNPKIAKIDDNYPKIISAEEMEKLIKPVKEPLDEIDKELGRYWSLNGIETARTLYSKTNIENTKKYLTPKEVIKEVEKGKEIIKKLERRDELRKSIDQIINSNTKTYSFEDTKKTHRKNMNTIYKCGLLSTQKKSFLLIKNDLLKPGHTVSKKLVGKLSANISKLDNMFNSLNCKNSNDKNSVQKLILLKQATYQTCKYVSYLEYTKEYNKNIQNNLDPKKGHYTPLEIVQTQKEKIGEINSEIQNTYKVFPLAFQAYTEYENNITAHILLQLLKEDYIALREKLHKALNPINQVVYKISNAMKK